MPRLLIGVGMLWQQPKGRGHPPARERSGRATAVGRTTPASRPEGTAERPTRLDKQKQLRSNCRRGASVT